MSDQVFVDVFEGRRRRHWLEYAETETMSLVGLMVGILTYDHHLDISDRRGREGIEDVLHLRINLHQ